MRSCSLQLTGRRGSRKQHTWTDMLILRTLLSTKKALEVKCGALEFYTEWASRDSPIETEIRPRWDGGKVRVSFSNGPSCAASDGVSSLSQWTLCNYWTLGLPLSHPQCAESSPSTRDHHKSFCQSSTRGHQNQKSNTRGCLAFQAHCAVCLRSMNQLLAWTCATGPPEATQA